MFLNNTMSVLMFVVIIKGYLKNANSSGSVDDDNSSESVKQIWTGQEFWRGSVGSMSVKHVVPDFLFYFASDVL